MCRGVRKVSASGDMCAAVEMCVLTGKPVGTGGHEEDVRDFSLCLHTNIFEGDVKQSFTTLFCHYVVRAASLVPSYVL